MSDRRPAPTNFLIVLLSFFLAFAALGRAASISTQLTTSEKNQLQREARLVVDLVQNLHYSGATFHEINNEEILTRFLNELDPGRDFFGPDDVAFVHRRFDRSLKSVYLFRGNLEPAFEIFDLYVSLARDRLAWIDQRLDHDFDFTPDDTYVEWRAGTPPPSPEISLDQHWEQRLKDYMLHEILSGRTPQEARAELRRVYAEFGRSIAAFDSFAVRERFLDAAIRSFDPHSGYSSADSTREFAVEMKGAVTGVGLAVRKEHGHCIITSVNPGGPADLHSTLAPGDTIEALAEGDGPWVDTGPQRLRELVGAMRGSPGSKLRIAYRAAGTSERREVSLERIRVVLSSERAHGAISQVPVNGTRFRSIGWIRLPAFYTGGEGEDSTSAARDLRELVEQMKAAKVDGLVLDLRGNPGGAMTEAVAISQLFLAGGTVLLSRGPDGQLKSHAVREEAPLYGGPLVILTSSLSASASEIFAGAMKYHHRALIVGSASTFGKGTVQNYIDLAKVQGLSGSSVKDWGTLRLTSERFYLPDGSAVQGKGVASQVVFPDFEPAGLQRESDLPHALPPEIVQPPSPTMPTTAPTVALPPALEQTLLSDAQADLTSRPEWRLWSKEQKFYQTMADRQGRPLNMATRTQEWEVKLREFETWRQTWRDFAVRSAFASRPIEVTEVKAAQEAHQRKLRALEPIDGQPPLHRLNHGVFLVETDQGHLRDLRIQDFDFLLLQGDAETLAEAFAQGSGQSVTPANLRLMLQRLSLLEYRTDEAVLAVVAKITGGAPDSPALRKGTEALLLRITELVPELRQELATHDVPMRESLRLAADWADQVAAHQP
ncbi:MAG: S41 family peptidase [Opitutaceae bacterium]